MKDSQEKLLFLDIDGVLNDTGFNVDWCHRFKRGVPMGFNPRSMEALNQVIEATQCELVLSSSWRLDIPDNITLEGFDFLLKTHGCRKGVVGVTPISLRKTPPPTPTPSNYNSRTFEIQEYLDTHKHARYAVVDDDFIDIPNFVQTNPDVGLTFTDAAMLITILNSKEQQTDEIF